MCTLDASVIADSEVELAGVAAVEEDDVLATHVINLIDSVGIDQ